MCACVVLLAGVRTHEKRETDKHLIPFEEKRYPGCQKSHSVVVGCSDACQYYCFDATRWEYPLPEIGISLPEPSLCAIETVTKNGRVFEPAP